MKRTIFFLGVVILIVMSFGMAAAAPAPSNVIVTNTSANPVPVNVQPRTTQVLFSGTFTSGQETNLNVSACSQIRITASIDKEVPNAPSIFLSDQSAGSLFAPILIQQLNTTTPYFSQVLDTPGSILTLTLIVYVDSPLSIVVYCR
jgi:hypothetical protein